MPFKCDLTGCENEARFWLEYAHERRDEGLGLQWGEPNYTGYRCEGHILSMREMNHPSCGLPESIYEFDSGGTPRFDLVDKIVELWKESQELPK